MSATEHMKSKIPALRVNVRVHYSVCERLLGWHRGIGTIVVLLSTITLAFAFSDPAKMATVTPNALAIASVFAATLAGIQTFAGFAERAQEHQGAAVGYAKLLREFEARTSGAYSEEENKVVLDSLLSEWEAISSAAPLTKKRHREAHS